MAEGIIHLGIPKPKAGLESDPCTSQFGSNSPV